MSRQKNGIGQGKWENSSGALAVLAQIDIPGNILMSSCKKDVYPVH